MPALSRGIKSVLKISILARKERSDIVSVPIPGRSNRLIAMTFKFQIVSIVTFKFPLKSMLR
jgi:hypothetical protein